VLSPATDPAASAETISVRPLPAPRRTRPADSDHTATPPIAGSQLQQASPTAAATASSPADPARLPSAFAPSVPTFTPVAVIAAALPARTPARAVRAARSAQAAAVRPPADPVLAMGTMITGLLTSATNWASGLPANPVSELLEGALLLVRRTLTNLFPTLNPGQTTGQGATTATGAYYTDAELRDYLLGLAMQQYGSLFGQTVPVYGNGGPWPDYYYLKMDGVVASTGITSGTNTQVNGVDEADFVETDGQYLYVAHNGQLQIVGADLTVAYQTPLSGNVVGQFLAGARLTVITQSGYGWYGPMAPMVRMAWGPWSAMDPQTTVTVYDVTDRTAPTVVTQTMFDGRYQEARSVDGVVYLVLQRGLDLPAPSYTDTPVTPDTSEPVDGQVDLIMKPGRWEPTITAYRTYETWDQ
jgi:hypothetical protein